MSRKIIAASVVFTSIACSDRAALTSPKVSDSRLASASVASCSPAEGQALIEAGQYKHAIREFGCVIAADPTSPEGYRGRAEAALMLGKFSDAAADYARIAAFVKPVHPDAHRTIIAGYEARLRANPDGVAALTGQSFAYWWDFDYAAALQALEHLLDVKPNDVYGTLLRGSARYLRGRAAGAADLDRAIALAPGSPDVRWIVADAYTYGAVPDAQRAFDEATFALEGGLDTPRVRAILAASYVAFGDLVAAGVEIQRHLDLVTTQLVSAAPLAAGGVAKVNVGPGRTFEIPLQVSAGETVSVLATSKDFFDTILVLLGPDGTPILGSDDYKAYFAGFVWVAPTAGTYKLRVTSFESVSTGTIAVARN